jgi:hypothetical protein
MSSQIEDLRIKAREVAKILRAATGCDVNLDKFLEKFNTIDDIIAELTDINAFNEYPCTAPSVQKCLTAIALTASLCYYDSAIPLLSSAPPGFCEKFFKALGEFIVSIDSRAFLGLGPDYSDP